MKSFLHLLTVLVVFCSSTLAFADESTVFTSQMTFTLNIVDNRPLTVLKNVIVIQEETAGKFEIVLFAGKVKRTLYGSSKVVLESVPTEPKLYTKKTTKGEEINRKDGPKRATIILKIPANMNTDFLHVCDSLTPQNQIFSFNSCAKDISKIDYQRQTRFYSHYNSRRNLNMLAGVYTVDHGFD